MIEKMKNKRIILLCIIIFILIVCITGILITIKLLSNVQQEEIENKPTPRYIIPKTEEEEEQKKKLGKENRRSNYYMIKACVNKVYLYYYNAFNEKTEENANRLYNLLDEKYIDYKNITNKNILEKIEEINEVVVNINEIYVSHLSNTIDVNLVIGRLREKSSEDIKDFNIKDFKMMVIIDYSNKAFKVILNDYIEEYYSDLKLGDEVKISIPEKISKNQDNVTGYQVIDDERYCKDLLLKYKEEAMFDKEMAYNHLYAKYRENRFESLSEFETYIKTNMRDIVTISLNKYQKNVYDDYTEYICVDTKNNYYIFYEETIMNYGMIFDLYSIETPHFTNEYDVASEQKKVVLNISRLKEAINAKDYRYVYKHLNSTFSNNNFSNLNQFEQYLKERFYESNDITYGKFEEISNDTYTYELIIKNTENANETKNLTIIMKLHENYDFEISF